MTFRKICQKCIFFNVNISFLCLKRQISEILLMKQQQINVQLKPDVFSCFQGRSLPEQNRRRLSDVIVGSLTLQIDV